MSIRSTLAWLRLHVPLEDVIEELELELESGGYTSLSIESPPCPSLDSLLKYRRDLTDAVSGGPVTNATQLIALHQPEPHTEEGWMIRNLTRVARPAASCSLVVGAQVFPPAGMLTTTDDPPYFVFVTFNRLLMAPVIRLEFVWPTVASTQGQLQVSLEFHFNAVDTIIPAVDDFSFTSATGTYDSATSDELSFTSRGATCEGFTNAMDRSDIIGFAGAKLLAEIDRLRTPGADIVVRLHLFQSLHEDNDSCLARILPFMLTDNIHRLPSLTAAEWTCSRPLDPNVKLRQLIYAEVPHPMVAFDSHDTFSSIVEASTELYESARISHLEQELALEEWAAVLHWGALYRVGGMNVMTLRSGSHRYLGGSAGIASFRLPDRIQVQMDWEDPFTGDLFHVQALRTLVPLHLPSYDAAFLITGHTTTSLRHASVDPYFDAGWRLVVRCSPSTPKFTLRSQLATAMDLAHVDADPWRPLILNQDYRQLPVIDIATNQAAGTLDPQRARAVEQAYQSMLRWRTWNPEQLQALESVRKAVGGICIICGPPGCGKTLVQQALCVFLFTIGLHVLVLAPANSNCADFMRKLVQTFPDLPATRIFPASTELDLQTMSRDTPGSIADDANENAGPIANIFELEMVRAEVSTASDRYAQACDLGLQAQVLKAARQGSFMLMGTFNDRRGGPSGPPVDMWGVLKRAIERNDTHDFDWGDEDSVSAYEQSYQACKGHFVALSRLLVTTTGNVRCADIIDNWAQDKHDLRCEGVVILLDESCKDKEVNTLSALLCPAFGQKVTGLIMFGDERQLEPTITPAKGSVQFNPFNQRLNIPWLSRLKRQGFPCVELLEQHRMNAQISSWPFREFYPPGMRNAKDMHMTLNEKLPGLRACLLSILKDLPASFARPQSELELDRLLRTHYVEINGFRDNTKLSAVVKEHIVTFFTGIYWYLHAYFGVKMGKSVMIIVGYKEAQHCWREAVMYLQRKYGIPNSQMPRIVTIDSSQGCEALVTFIDCSVQKYSPSTRRRDIGFIDDDKRINVAMTRAREVRWFLGGSCSVTTRQLGLPETPAYVRYKEEISGSDQVSILNNRLVTGNANWLCRMKQKVVSLQVHYVDEVAHSSVDDG